jgi:hypothetical protein
MGVFAVVMIGHSQTIVRGRRPSAVRLVTGQFETAGHAAIVVSAA